MVRKGGTEGEIGDRKESESIRASATGTGLDVGPVAPLQNTHEPAAAKCSGAEAECVPLVHPSGQQKPSTAASVVKVSINANANDRTTVRLYPRVD
jgi:hypothetical protein